MHSKQGSVPTDTVSHPWSPGDLFHVQVGQLVISSHEAELVAVPERQAVCDTPKP